MAVNRGEDAACPHPPDRRSLIAAPLPPRLLDDTATLFGLLASAPRLYIVWPQPAAIRATVSHHVGKLRLGGIVRAQRVGRRPIYVVQDTRAVELVRLAVEGRLGEWGPDRPVRHA